jgi:hypothetical protein
MISRQWVVSDEEGGRIDGVRRASIMHPRMTFSYVGRNTAYEKRRKRQIKTYDGLTCNLDRGATLYRILSAHPNEGGKSTHRVTIQTSFTNIFKDL